MEGLKLKRQIIKATITRIFNTCQSPTISVSEFRGRINHLEELFKNYDEVQSSIDSLTTTAEELEVQMEYRTEIEEKYYRIKSWWYDRNVDSNVNQESNTMRSIVESLNQNQSTLATLVERMSVASSTPSSEIRINNDQGGLGKLPRIELPEFDGTYLNWIRFRDLFETMVHSRTSLNGVQKFEYLQGRLKGDALSLVKHLKPTNDNYTFAWELIKTKYDNASHIKRAYLELIFDQKEMKLPNVNDIRQFFNKLNEGTNALKAFDEPVEHWDSVLLFHLERKLDSETSSLWCREIGATTATFQQFLTFIGNRVHELERRQPPKIIHQDSGTRTRSSQAIHATMLSACPTCQERHFIYSCPRFKAKPVVERIKFVRENNLCYNCLESGHQANDCKRSTCRICKDKYNTLMKHNTLLHRPKEGSHVINSQAVQIGVGMTPKPSVTTVLLPTAVVLVQGKDSKYHPVRVLLDTGAQATLITEACVQRLRLKRSYDKTLLCGIGLDNNYTHGKLTVYIKSTSSNNQLCTEAFVLNALTQNQPSCKVPESALDFFKHLQLADPQCNMPNSIDMILGADIVAESMLQHKCVHPSGSPSALLTVFGWVLFGKVAINQEQQITVAHVSMDLTTQLQRFWEVENLEVTQRFLTAEEEQAEQHYKENVTRDASGRYVVRLPFKSPKVVLGDSRVSAVKRLQHMEKRFMSNQNLHDEYRKFMAEYEQLNHMMRQDCINDHTQYFMPHHAVFKPSSTTTKLRVVFDASSKASGGKSLNEELLVGPTIQNDLFTILLRFRKYEIGMSADIEKMYRQILVHPDDQGYQGIVWRDNKDEQLSTYHLKTVTYGTSAAPFLAIRTLKQVGIECSKTQPQITKTIDDCFYVDDFMSSARTVESAASLRSELCTVLLASSFRLRKWCSNSTEFLDTIDNEDREQATRSFIDCDQTTKTLGLMWNMSEDTFRYIETMSTPSSVATKRTVLSDISRVFDPIGWVSPLVISMKIFIQKLWLKGLDWDTPLSGDLKIEWNQFHHRIKLISQLKIPRWLRYSDELHAELHGFADSSELAYAAAVYLKIIHQNGEVSTRLVASKTRVAPVKQITLPRLELCAAHLAVKLLIAVERALDITLIGKYGWSDSTIVLAWIADHPRRWKSFVANRTSFIIDNIPAQFWHHIASKHNPADIATRGASTEELLSSELWWNGPEVLKNHEYRRPVVNTHNVADMEERKAVILHNSEAVRKDLWEQYSDFTKLLRTTAYVLRFVRNSRPKKYTPKTGFLTTNELGDAHDMIMKRSQAVSYSAEIKVLRKGNQLPKNHKLAPLSPFIDNKGLLRVGGRLNNANIGYEQKHPLIIHKEAYCTRLIIKFYHLKYLHAGSRQLQYLLAKRYWIPAVTHAIKRCVYQCVTCIRFRSKPYEQQMADLPKRRLETIAAFCNTGVDFAGPVQIRSWKGRGSKRYKAWIAVFVCFATKAVYLDLVTELTAEAFLATLRRFVARRGKPSHIYSDNGTNFVGCNQKLLDLVNLFRASPFQDKLTKEMSQQGIEWHFSPPSGPHFGGLWEAGVKSVKYHLNRTLGESSATYEEFVTVLTQIEACLNSRPLCLKFEGDLDPLTPAHFLLGRPIEAAPDECLADIKVNRLTRWQYLQQLLQGFWRRWSLDYLHQLQGRPKWVNKVNNVKRDDVVIIKDDNLPPTQWSLGRVTETHPGDDGLVRVVTVKTARGTYRRPVCRLCPLFVEC